MIKLLKAPFAQSSTLGKLFDRFHRSLMSKRSTEIGKVNFDSCVRPTLARAQITITYFVLCCRE